MVSIEQMAKYMVDNGTDYYVVTDSTMLVMFGNGVWLCDCSKEMVNLDMMPKIKHVIKLD